MFVSFDGIDGTGKSTQCRMLVDWLRERGRSVVHCAEPGTTDIGRTIREWILHGRKDMASRTEAMLFMAARAELVEKVIRPALGRGDDVICDRYLLSTLVYQGHGGGLDVEALRWIGSFVTQGVMPHLTFVLDLPVAAAKARLSGVPDRMESRDDDYFERVRRGFAIEASRDRRCRFIDASRSVDEIQSEIRRCVNGLAASSGA